MQINTLNSQQNYYIQQQNAISRQSAKSYEMVEIELDSVVAAFQKASDLVSQLTSNDMKQRLRPEESSANEAIKRAEVLRSSSSAVSTADAINKQNMLLASRNLPPMKPAEEQLFIDRIKLLTKERVTFLNSFLYNLKNSVN